MCSRPGPLLGDTAECLVSQVTFLLLMAFFRPSLKIMLEQPLSSWMFKQRAMLEVLYRWKLRRHLTYLGLFGCDLLKGVHLMSNLPTLKAIERRATKDTKEKHRVRVQKKRDKAIALGRKEKFYYVKNDNGFHGGPDLSKTAVYPQRFVTAVFRLWRQNHCCPQPLSE